MTLMLSNTSEIETDTIRAKSNSSEDCRDLFQRVHTLNLARKSVSVQKKQKPNHRLSTMGGYIVNKTTLLRFYIDDKNYVTIPVKCDTKAIDAIHTIIHRRRLPVTTQCTLLQDNQIIDPNANLHEIMQITSGARIQVHFMVNDDKDHIKKDHHLIHSITHSSDLHRNSHKKSNSAKMAQSPYRINQETTSHKSKSDLSPRWRTFPNKLNLIAFNTYSIHESDNNDDVSCDQVLQNIENSLNQIPREQYDVIKINKYNKHQKRILKLTEHGIENIKNKSGLFHHNEECVTSFHSWENITNAYLEDAITIRISYKDYENGDRTYQSPQANDINESIQKRLKIIRDEKTSTGRQEISIKFQKKLIHQQINSNRVFNLNDHLLLTRNRSGYIVYKGFVHFAPGEHFGIELDPIPRTTNDDDGHTYGDHDGFYDGIRYFQTVPKHGVIVPESQIIRKTIMKKSKSVREELRYLPSLSFSENEQMKISSPFLNGGIPSNAKMKLGIVTDKISAHDEIFKELKEMILSTDTLEGRYRLNFANKFHKYAKEDNLLELVREFMDAVKDKIHGKYAKKYKQWLMESVDDDEKFENGVHKVADICNNLIESAIEQTILQTKIREIYKICLQNTQAETQILSLKMEKLRHRNQRYFGIKTELESATNWNRAVYELSLLIDCRLPSEKIRSLVNCAHAIYLSYAKEQREKEKSIINGSPQFGNQQHGMKEHFITGDDFLPIVIYVIVQASKTKPCITDADLRIMEGLVDPAVNRSEPGYYLAVFHAALQWIRCFNN